MDRPAEAATQCFDAANSVSQALRGQLEAMSKQTLQSIGDSSPRSVRFAFDALDELTWLGLCSNGADFTSDWNEAQLEWSFALRKASLPRLVAESQLLETSDEHGHPRDARRVLLLCGPANHTRWNATKVDLTSLMTSSSSSSEELLQALVEELLFTSLVLSKAYKLGDVWSHRLWVWTQIMLVLGARVEEAALVSWVHSHDEHVLTDAFHNHPMNLNAWQYRRLLLNLCSKGSLFPLSPTTASLPPMCGPTLLLEIVQHHTSSALKFLKAHHRDTSCSRFLVDLLVSAGNVVASQEMPFLELQLLVKTTWISLLQLTSRLLAQTCATGHESLWHLRLGLIHFALHYHVSGTDRPLRGNWSVEDELLFVSTHMDGVIIDEPPHKPDIAACSGSVVFHQWHAARYGIQFLQLLSAS